MAFHHGPPPNPKKDVFFGLSTEDLNIEEEGEKKYAGTYRLRWSIEEAVVRLFSLPLPVGCTHTARSPCVLVNNCTKAFVFCNRFFSPLSMQTTTARGYLLEA